MLMNYEYLQMFNFAPLFSLTEIVQLKDYTSINTII